MAPNTSSKMLKQFTQAKELPSGDKQIAQERAFEWQEANAPDARVYGSQWPSGSFKYEIWRPEDLFDHVTNPANTEPPAYFDIYKRGECLMAVDLDCEGVDPDFDIDGLGRFTMKRLEGYLKKVAPTADISWLVTKCEFEEAKGKHSMHLLARGVKFPDARVLERFMEDTGIQQAVADRCNIPKALDMSIYGNKATLRQVFSSKAGKNKPLQPYDLGNTLMPADGSLKEYFLLSSPSNVEGSVMADYTPSPRDSSLAAAKTKAAKTPAAPKKTKTATPCPGQLSKSDFLDLLRLVDMGDYDRWLQCAMITRAEEERTGESYTEEFLDIARTQPGFPADEAKALQEFQALPAAKKSTVATLFHYAEADNRAGCSALRVRIASARTGLKSYEETKAAFEANKFKLLSPAVYAVVIDDVVHVKRPADFSHNYQNIFCLDDEGRRCNFLKRWVADPDMRTYDTLDFLPPPLDVPAGTYNTYGGLEGERLPGTWEELEDVDISKVLEHLAILCSREEVVVEYVLDWLAHIIQRPGLLPETMLLFQSQQGAGKNMFVDWFGRRMLGMLLYSSSSDINFFFSRFANGFHNILLANLDEVVSSATRGCLQQIKTQITAEITHHEKKGIDVMPTRNCARLLGTSNSAIPLYLEDNERRNCLIQCSNELCGNLEYFTELKKVLDDPRVQRKFFLYMQRRDLSRVNLRNRPKTAYYRQVKEASMDLFKSWLKWSVENGALPSNQYSSKVLQSVHDWARVHMPNAKPITGQKLGRLLKEYDGFSVDRTDRESALSGPMYQFDLHAIKAQMRQQELID